MIHPLRAIRRDAGESASTIRSGSVHLTPARTLSDDQGMRELPEDIDSKLGYRIAHGGAVRLAEMTTRFDHGRGKDFAAGIGGDTDVIDSEVMRRCSPRTYPRNVNLAVRDALEGLNPR
jgi:hypothetical protein